MISLLMSRRAATLPSMTAIASEHPLWSRVLAGVMRAQHEHTPSEYSTYAAHCITKQLPTLPDTAEEQLHDLLHALLEQHLAAGPHNAALLRTIAWAVLAELRDWLQPDTDDLTKPVEQR